MVDGQESPGPNASALIVLHMPSEMSDRWCLDAKHRNQHGRDLQTLFGPAIVTMQQFMWQGDLVQVAHFVSECFAVLETLGDD